MSVNIEGTEARVKGVISDTGIIHIGQVLRRSIIYESGGNFKLDIVLTSSITDQHARISRWVGDVGWAEIESFNISKVFGIDKDIVYGWEREANTHIFDNVIEELVSIGYHFE